MLKVRYLLFAVLVLLSGYLVSGIVMAHDIPLRNGGFETNGLAGWTAEPTAGGTLGDGYPKVVAFDIDGDGEDYNAAQFSVGSLSSSNKSYEGGSIYQKVHLVAGDYAVSADVAVDQHGTKSGVNKGGLFELLVDGLVVDSHEFRGKIGPNETKSKLLAGIRVVSEGDHEIRIKITRPYEPVASLTQLVDNVILQVATEASSVEPAPAPDCSNQSANKDDKLGANKGGNSDYDNCSKK